MHWIEEFRIKNQLSQEDFAAFAGCSAALIDILENMHRGRTHPNIANRIAELCGASARQRDSIVAAKHRGTWKPSGKSTLKKLMEKKSMRPRRQGNRSKPVVMIDRQGNIIKRYESAVEAAEECGHSGGYVTKRCGRDMRPKTDEFGSQGRSFRWAGEWEGLSDEQRKQDVRNAYLEEKQKTGCSPYIEWQGQRHTLAEWSRIANLPEGVLRRRIKEGWDIARAIKTPVQSLALRE